MFDKISYFISEMPKKLGTTFLSIMNFVTLITVLSLSVYYLVSVHKLEETSFTEKTATNKSISNIIFQVAEKEIATRQFTNLAEMSNKFVQNGLVTFVVIYDKNDHNKVLWSTYAPLRNSDLNIAKAVKEYKKQLSYEWQIGYSKEYISGYPIYVTYSLDSKLTSLINSFIKYNPYLVLIFILLGSLFSLQLIKIIINPIQDLTEGAKIFASGNLKHKIPLSKYNEINLLIRAFNEMAYKLDKIHSSLEEKIQERTKEVTEKNEELQKAYQELQEAQSLIVHSEKMRSLGELVTGITHEINNPVNFIYGNLIHLNNYASSLIEIIEKYKEIDFKLPEEDRVFLRKLIEEKEYDFIKDDLPDLLKSCREGTERTRNIVMDLKNFSRTDQMIINEIDIHKEINTTLNILYNKYKNRIKIHKEFGNVPPLDCYGGQINQVLMNIIDNAIFAIKDQGDIFIRTFTDEKNIIIEIEDNGIGIPKENLKKVFEPFFTTKTVGEGTGLGMAISYRIIETHNGKMEVSSELGRGTKFTITLPKEGLKKKNA